ncbi:hypothetical protein [Paenibacillus sp. GCM10027626]|uniref:hypothetical protein n=1 Tax=Paenibacillus sp. GCM10027626 TaxID=3273411 RepID=UPI00362B7DF9
MKGLLMFLLLSSMMCWFMFSPIYKHVLIVRQAVLQQEVDYMLEVAANGDHGYIDGAMIAGSRARLASYGLLPDKLTYAVLATNGADATDASRPLPRGVGIALTIGYPLEGLLNIDRLIGVAPPEEAGTGLRAKGIKMSEFVP